MKKIVLIPIVLGICFIASSVSAYAIYRSIDLPNLMVLQNNFADTENIRIARFIDGNNTCYLLSSKGTTATLQTSTSISCLVTPVTPVTPIQNK